MDHDEDHAPDEAAVAAAEADFEESEKRSAAANLQYAIDASVRLLDEVNKPGLREVLTPEELEAFGSVVLIMQMIGSDLLQAGSEPDTPTVSTWSPDTLQLVQDVDHVAERFDEVVRVMKASPGSRVRVVFDGVLSAAFDSAQYLILGYERWTAKHFVRLGPAPNPREQRVTAIKESLRDLGASQAAKQARAAASMAASSADAAREASGEAAESALAETFEELRAHEAKAGERFRWGAIVLYVATILFSGAVAFGLLHDDKALSKGALQRLAPGLPTLLLAVFLGYQARAHLRVASWAAVLVAQLKTIRAYTVDLDDEAARALRAEFGRRVFLQSPHHVDQGEQTGTPAEAGGSPDLLAIIREVAAIADRRPPTS